MYNLSFWRKYIAYWCSVYYYEYIPSVVVSIKTFIDMNCDTNFNLHLQVQVHHATNT